MKHLYSLGPYPFTDKSTISLFFSPQFLMGVVLKRDAQPGLKKEIRYLRPIKEV